TSRTDISSDNNCRSGFFDLSSRRPRSQPTACVSLSLEGSMKKKMREFGSIMVLAAAVFGPTAFAQHAAAPPAAGPDLVAALKATPGILGVATAQTGTGKQVIFAWVENKKAVLNWY